MMDRRTATVLNATVIVLLSLTLVALLCAAMTRNARTGPGVAPPPPCEANTPYLIMAGAPDDDQAAHDPLGPLQPATGPGWYVPGMPTHGSRLPAPNPEQLDVRRRPLASPYGDTAVDYGGHHRNEAAFQINQFEAGKAKLVSLQQSRAKSARLKRRQSVDILQELSRASAARNEAPRDEWRMANCVGGCEQACAAPGVAPADVRRCREGCAIGCRGALQ